MKDAGLLVLLILGVVEISYGILFGRLRIYAYEAPFALAMQLDEKVPEQRHAFQQYIAVFKDQSGIVTWFGALTIGAAALIWLANRKKPLP